LTEVIHRIRSGVRAITADEQVAIVATPMLEPFPAGTR
jgi:hypothetical protein